MTKTTIEAPQWVVGTATPGPRDLAGLTWHLTEREREAVRRHVLDESADER